MNKTVVMLMLLSVPANCFADYELRLNDGVTLTWREYSIQGSQYCTHNEFGKFCVQRSDVVGLKEIMDRGGNVTPKKVSETSDTGENRDQNILVEKNKEVLTVKVASVISGQIYLDGHYTGKITPAVLELPTPGLHIIGVGGDNNRYQEIKIEATTRQTEVHFKDSGWLPSKTWKILLLSVRNANLEGHSPAHLTDNDISEAYNSVLRTSQEWIRDYTYGLAEWHVEKMTVENVYGHVQYDSTSEKYGDQIDDARLLKDANLMGLLDTYDSVFVFWPSVPDGSDQDPKGGCRGLCCFRG